MDKHDISLLVEQQVSVAFIATPAPKPGTWHLLVKRGLATTLMTTTRGTDRVFRSLDPIARFVSGELGCGFEVAYSRS